MVQPKSLWRSFANDAHRWYKMLRPDTHQNRHIDRDSNRSILSFQGKSNVSTELAHICRPMIRWVPFRLTCVMTPIIRLWAHVFHGYLCPIQPLQSRSSCLSFVFRLPPIGVSLPHVCPYAYELSAIHLPASLQMHLRHHQPNNCHKAYCRLQGLDQSMWTYPLGVAQQ